MKYAIYIVLIMSMLLISIMAGCAPIHPPVPVTTVTHTTVTSTPASLAVVGHGLDYLILAAVIATGIGVGLFFALPASHNISIPIGAVAVSVGVASILLKVSLFAIPWIAAGLGVVALVVCAYEVYRNRAALESKFGDPNLIVNALETEAKKV